MSFIDELKRLARPYEDEDEDQFEDDFTPVSSREPVREPERRNNKVVNIHTTTQLQVVLVKPERFENASEIADHLRDKRTVVLNLEQTDKNICPPPHRHFVRRGLCPTKAPSRRWPCPRTSLRPITWRSWAI